MIYLLLCTRNELRARTFTMANSSTLGIVHCVTLTDCPRCTFVGRTVEMKRQDYKLLPNKTTHFLHKSSCTGHHELHRTPKSSMPVRVAKGEMVDCDIECHGITSFPVETHIASIAACSVRTKGILDTGEKKIKFLSTYGGWTAMFQIVTICQCQCNYSSNSDL